MSGIEKTQRNTTKNKFVYWFPKLICTWIFFLAHLLTVPILILNESLIQVPLFLVKSGIKKIRLV